jgi:hypothetical protein|tara:strand:+ start:59 stop:277 length:219 start_codon:yes stop_codon:yes gene_type:complete
MNEEKAIELTPEQEYCKAQIADLMQKQATLNFQLDQVKASLSVFNNLMAESTKEVAKEVLKEEKSDNTKGGK